MSIKERRLPVESEPHDEVNGLFKMVSNYLGALPVLSPWSSVVAARCRRLRFDSVPPA